MMNQDYPVSPPDNLPVPDANRHPITPPPELVQQWLEEADQYQDDPTTYFDHVAIEAAHWGADQELEACCEWLDYTYPSVNCAALRADRRPKPPSLKELALKALDSSVELCEFNREYDIIRRALEALDD